MEKTCLHFLLSWREITGGFLKEQCSLYEELMRMILSMDFPSINPFGFTAVAGRPKRRDLTPNLVFFTIVGNTVERFEDYEGSDLQS